MCGRYFIDSEMMAEIGKITRNVEADLAVVSLGDIFPSNQAPVLRQKDKKVCISTMRWGFCLERKGSLLINARAETVLERRGFRDSVRQRRCVLPARSFYEWSREKEKAVFERKDRGILYMAGIFGLWQNQERFVVLTTEANSSVLPVHDRMPLILEENEWKMWLEPEVPAEKFLMKMPALLQRHQEYEQQTLPFL